jgi:diguanylate cyclase (GGDEF)-like protein
MSKRFNQSRREQFLLLLQETKSRKELSDRTIELEKTQAELKLLAMTDPLTGISNRRHFMRKISEELERTKRYGKPFSLMALDIDHFKDINDNHGHEAGDEVLRSFATHCLSHLRSNDQLARFGGDEFFALLIQTGQDEAKAIAKRIRASIEDMEIPIDSGMINTSVSIGLTTTEGNKFSVEELVKRADKALYKAKKRGRNQVVIV